MLFDGLPQYGPLYCPAKVFSDMSEMGLPSISSETRAGGGKKKGGGKKNIALLFSVNMGSCFSLIGRICQSGDDCPESAL